MLSLSCEKQVYDKPLTAHVDRKLVANGRISPDQEQQCFILNWSSNLGDTATERINDATVRVVHGTEVYIYSNQGNGKYLSDSVFAGIPGDLYTISIGHESVNYTVNTHMPSPLEITQISLEQEVIVLNTVNADVNISLNSDAAQHFRYQVYVADFSALPNDTVWESLQLPLYQTVSIPSGPSVSRLNPASTLGQFEFNSGDLIQVKVYSLSEDAALYLQNLQDYVTNELINSQFQNPPFYYSNGGYGFGYGTCVDSKVYLID